MKNMKKLIALVLIAIIAVSPVTSKVNAISNVSGNTLKYYAVILGTSNDEVIQLLNETSALEFEEILESMLESRKYTDDMYNLENNISTENVTLSLSINECALLFDTDTSEINNHLSICGINVYNKIISEFNNYNTVNEKTTNASLQSTEDYLTDGLWEKICTTAHTGNILITKDSTTLSYRHGHVGVIQNHNSDPKYISEAFEHDDPKKQVICRPLFNSKEWNVRDTYWGQKKSLCSTYPDTPTVTDRERAGNQTWYYAESDYYTYKALNTKTEAIQESSRELNCVGVAFRAYFFMANYDIIPQVDKDAVMLPSHVYYSPNTRIKTDSKGYLLRTPYFEQIEWGF